MESSTDIRLVAAKNCRNDALPEATEDQRQLLVRLRDRIYSEASPEPPEKPAVVIELDNIIQIDHQQNGHQQQN